ncbi:MAG TPA: tRNA (adenosine(37)-N6)-threonylcarbamoyltransferase complex dimerization subunit type 1 TsaB [Candidatus Methylacidiphilales bacterium]|nr:tRNA (adenosine(37)-N6)-threonylcarbamoyltransferase complex dimerization subunit type 1 TsaB [Candidatus Methylacidiphilales bacterium]
MLDLAIETSSSTGSIALGNDKVIVQSIEFKSPQRHSAALFPALTRLGIPRLKLRRIVVGLGPGSFSGIRVGLAVAQGLALVQGVPVVGISSAYSVAHQYRDVPKLGVFADAKRREVFCTPFVNGELEQGTYLIPMEEIKAYEAQFSLAVSAEPLPGITTLAYPRAKDLLALPDTLVGWVKNQPLEPIYLREPVAAKPE